MELSSNENTIQNELSGLIKENLREILFSADIIQWYEKYKETCDSLIMKIYDKRNIETYWMTESEKMAWKNIPDKLKVDILKMVDNQFNLKSFSIMPPPFSSIVKRKQFEIPIRRQLINELKRIRDNEIGEFLNDFSENCNEEKWENTTDSLKQLIEENWRTLAKLTIKLCNSVLFVDNFSNPFWKKLTYEWSKDYFIC
jgi:hypothetical protein